MKKNFRLAGTGLLVAGLMGSALVAPGNAQTRGTHTGRRQHPTTVPDSTQTYPQYATQVPDNTQGNYNYQPTTPRYGDVPGNPRASAADLARHERVLQELQVRHDRIIAAQTAATIAGRQREAADDAARHEQVLQQLQAAHDARIGAYATVAVPTHNVTTPPGTYPPVATTAAIPPRSGTGHTGRNRQPGATTTAR